MIPLKYSYLTGCLFFLIVWGVLFWHRRDLRRAIIIMSLIGAVGSAASAYYWTMDWWRPLTITGTRIGFEDFVLGFSNGGIATVLYLELFHRRFFRMRTLDQSKVLPLFVINSVLIFWLMINALGFSSFAACMITMFVYAGTMLLFRRDLFISCLLNGLLMVFVAVPIYYSSKIISPEALKTFYPYLLHPNIRLAGVPIQEFIFYFGFGFVTPLMYDFWHNLKTRKFGKLKTARKQAVARA